MLALDVLNSHRWIRLKSSRLALEPWRRERLRECMLKTRANLHQALLLDELLEARVRPWNSIGEHCCSLRNEFLVFLACCIFCEFYRLLLDCTFLYFLWCCCDLNCRVIRLTLISSRLRLADSSSFCNAMDVLIRLAFRKRNTGL